MSKKTDQKMSAKEILGELRQLARDDKAEFLPGFFQAFPGGYGEGDRFLGVVVPDQRKVANRFSQLSRNALQKLLASPWHECRLTALFILVKQFERAGKPPKKSGGRFPASESDQVSSQREIVDFYLEHLDQVNNWDLVDSSAHKILGVWILQHPREARLLRQLAKSDSLWRQRVAVIATLPSIQVGQFDLILRFAEQFLTHEHDLMHKAVGWMLREMGKRDVSVLRAFLENFASRMPRTMLRYSIEKLSPDERQKWLKTQPSTPSRKSTRKNTEATRKIPSKRN